MDRDGAKINKLTSSRAIEHLCELSNLLSLVALHLSLQSCNVRKLFAFPLSHRDKYFFLFVCLFTTEVALLSISMGSGQGNLGNPQYLPEDTLGHFFLLAN